MIINILDKLVTEGSLIKCNEPKLLEKELFSLYKLQEKEPKTYLVNYDILFRYVSIWLYNQGYSFTNIKPHKVLQKICGYYLDKKKVEEIISFRHSLKYDNISPDKNVEDNLASLTLKIKNLIGQEGNLEKI